MTHAISKKNNFDLAWKTSLNIIGNLASCEIVLYVKFKETQFELTKLVLPDFNVNFLSYLSVWSKLESLLSTANFAETETLRGGKMRNNELLFHLLKPSWFFI